MDDDTDKGNSSSKSKQECFVCKEIALTLLPFSCQHQICPRCIIQTIFCYQINQLNNVNQLEIKCICSQAGVLSLTVQQLTELFSDYKRTPDIKELECNEHQLKKEHYCKECNYLLCQRCIEREENGHMNHRVELKSTLAKKIHSLLPNMSMSIIPIEVFDTQLNDISSKFQKDVTGNFKVTMRNIESLIKLLQNVQESYNNAYVKLIEKGVSNLKLVKLFYQQFYSDLKDSDQSDFDDINALRYLNNIGYVFSKIEVIHDQEIDRIVNDIKKRVEEIKNIPEPLSILFEYNEVPRSYRCTNIITKAHPELIKSVIQLQDETIITGGNDSTIKIWKNNIVEYMNASFINKFVGTKINALLEISNNRIISSTEGEGDIKIWKQNNSSYSVQQSLSHHQTNVTCLAQFPDGKLVSGSIDKTAVVFKEIAEDTFETIFTIDQVNEPIFGLLPLDKERLIIQTTNKLHCYKETESKFEPGKVFELPSSSSNKMIKTMCLVRDNKIACAGSTKKIFILNQEEMSVNQALEKHQGEVNAVIQLRDGNLASASQDHNVIIWDLDPGNNTYRVHYVIADYNHGLYSLIELKDGQLCASCSYHNLIFWRSRNNYY